MSLTALPPLPVWLIVRAHNAASPTLAYLKNQQLPLVGEQWAVILEGGINAPETLSSAANIVLHQLAPQCFCCVGLLPLRVTLARLLLQRQRGKLLQRLILEISPTAHYDKVLELLRTGTLGEHLLLQPSPTV